MSRSLSKKVVDTPCENFLVEPNPSRPIGPRLIIRKMHGWFSKRCKNHLFLSPGLEEEADDRGGLAASSPTTEVRNRRVDPPTRKHDPTPKKTTPSFGVAFFGMREMGPPKKFRDIYLGWFLKIFGRITKYT